jgi:hypothetical protein
MKMGASFGTSDSMPDPISSNRAKITALVHDVLYGELTPGALLDVCEAFFGKVGIPFPIDMVLNVIPAKLIS